MQANTNTNSSRATLSAQSSGTPSASTISSSGKQQVVELSGYVIILVENVDGKIKLYGSPPDRDNLEVGDEILEVNGLTLDNISRTEIIRHIHDCIKTCTICLRVRKKNDTRLAWDIGNSVQDAFVIAVEEHARERLQRLAALNRVTPVDITQLSKKLQQTKSGSTTTSATTATTITTTTTTGTLKQQPKQDLSFLHEASPIYVTSFNSNQIACQSDSTPTTASTATSGLITATTITPTPAAVVVATAAATAATAGKSLTTTTTITATSIVGSSNNSIANDLKTPATSLLTNHSIYQQQQQQQLKLASSVQHLALAEEDYDDDDDDDDDEDAAVAANYCSINFINYKNKHAEIPTPTTTISGINNCIATITTNNKDTQALAAGVLNTFSATATVHHYQQEQQQQQQQQQNYRDHIPPPLQISPLINKPKYVDAQTLTSPRLAKDVSGLTVKRQQQQQKQQQQLYNNYKNNNNNNNLTTKLSTEIAITTTTTTTETAAAATKLSNNNNSTSFNNLVTNNFILGLEKAAATTTTTITCTLNNLIKTTINNINTTTTLNSSGLIAANSIIPETTTKLTTKKPTHISNNYDLYLTNNIQAPRRELLNQLNQDSAHHYLVDELEDEDDVDDDKQLSSLSYNNSQQQQQQQQFLYDNKQLNYSPNHSISKGRTELLLGDPSLRQEIRPRRRSGSSIVVIDGDDLKPCLPDDYISGQHYRTHTDDSKDIDQEMLTMLSLNQDKGPHREMAVDCPDNFIARNKTPPRYPPPRPPQLNGSVKPIPPPRDVATLPRGGDIVDSGSGGGRFVKNRLTSGPPSPPPPQLPDRKIILNNNNNTTIVAPIVGQQQQQIAQIVEPTLEQLDSIKKYQEQLRRRREEEERIAQQNEFLRASLRSSRKLKALQDTKSIQHHQQQAPPVPAERTHGVENEAYVEDENLERLAGYGDLMGALTHLQNQLTKNGMSTLAGRVSAAHNVLSNAGVAHALAARVAVLQRRQPKVTNPVHINSMQLQRDIVELLAKSNAASSIELGNLLTSHEMEGLLLAHDRVATHTDLTPSPLLSGAASPHTTSHPLSPVSVAAAPSLPSAVPMVPPLSIPPKTTSLRAVPSPVVPQRDAMPLPPNITPHHTQLSQTAIYPGTISMHAVDSPPPLSACFGTLNDQNDNIRIIKIEKSTEPLGATVRNEGEAVVIGRIVRGGAAEKSGLLHEGDEILEVNGQELRGKTVNEVCALLGTMQGTLTFLIVPAGSPPSGGGLRENAVLHVRAHFDYDPEEDLYIPCRELGISFQKGDVLHVISREDPNWWQAYREGEEDQTLAGLIPSQSFQHQRETMKLAIAEEAGLARRSKDGNNKGATLLCARKGRKKKKKASSEAGYPLYATTAPDETEPEEILTYEEVALYYPRATHKRPIVLIGPPNIGRHELRQRLMADSERFSAAVPHTSRARREGEVPGVDYHFITRQAFESDILARRFVEHGEYEKAYYGTSLEAIRAVVASGKICVLNLHPQSLKLLRASDLKPYVVLVAPPSLDKLRQKKLRNGEPFKEEELKDIIATARDMEARWGHLFDMIIINNDTERAYHQLLAEINSLEREPQWVPASWVHNNRDD